MKKIAAVIAAGVIALGLAGCTPRTTLVVDEHGNLAVFEEIVFTKKDQATMGVNTCDGILDRLKSVDDGSWELSPDRVTAGEPLSGGDGSALVCRFYSDYADSLLKRVSLEGDVAVIDHDTATLKLNSHVTDNFKSLIMTMSQVQGYDVVLSSLIVRMPGDVVRAVNGGEKIPFVSGRDVMILTDALGKDLVVVSSLETVEKPVSTPSVKATSAPVEQDTGDFVGVVVVAVILFLIVGLLVAVVVLVRKNRRLKNQSQGGQPGAAG